ncbi:hypothetical protein CEXT_674571 [Caerostris extrusa]|uniref:Reverse transcriptase n=1 Tax=Caerostris extrusa TaxID=172846 RepID=A0AAV4S4P9_CAEEX|nr:hypothetical protein CEXT_674571 [Caerostris extrusa]
MATIYSHRPIITFAHQWVERKAWSLLCRQIYKNDVEGKPSVTRIPVGKSLLLLLPYLLNFALDASKILRNNFDPIEDTPTQSNHFSSGRRLNRVPSPTL